MDESNKMLGHVLAIVAARNNFYKNKFRIMLGVYFLSFFVIILLSFILYHLVMYPPQPLYFIADRAGRLMQEPPIQEPSMSTADVSAWAVEAVEAATSYNFMNYHGQLQNAQKYFSEIGWRNYMNSLKSSNNLIALTTRRYVIIANVVAAPILVTEGILGGAYAWKFDLPVLVSYYTPPYGENDKFQNPLTFTVVIQRQNILKSYKGLAIVQLIGSMAMPTKTETGIQAAPS